MEKAASKNLSSKRKISTKQCVKLTPIDIENVYILNSGLISFLFKILSLSFVEKLKSKSLDHPPPRFGVPLDVTLGRLQRTVTSQGLHISLPPANCENLPGCVRNERPPSGA